MIEKYLCDLVEKNMLFIEVDKRTSENKHQQSPIIFRQTVVQPIPLLDYENRQ